MAMKLGARGPQFGPKKTAARHLGAITLGASPTTPGKQIGSEK
jgi:hypothetical protein